MQKIDKYLSLKKRVDQAQQEADKAEGALGEVMGQIKNEFSCDTLSAAKKARKQLQLQKESSGKAFDDALENFEETWNEGV